MLNCVYRLTSPRVFEPVLLDLQPMETDVIIRPTFLSICNADMRYYRGARSAEVLAEKLPMALIHEAIGEVISDPNGVFSSGDRVVLVPNAPLESDPFRAENYMRSSRFCGSGFDGFMQELVALPLSRVVSLPDAVNDEVAAFTELVSVAMHAVSRFGAIAHEGRRDLAVWGDGNLGFIVSLLLKFRFPEARIHVFGRNDYKLNDFTFADDVCLTCDIPDSLSIDHAFECCGGDGSASAIDQIIRYSKPEATVSLLGVSENPIPINTRMVLEKGMRFFGSSRSGRADFQAVAALYAQQPAIVDYLASLVGSVQTVSSIHDISKAFETDLRKSGGKTIMKWNL